MQYHIHSSKIVGGAVHFLSVEIIDIFYFFATRNNNDPEPQVGSYTDF